MKRFIAILLTLLIMMPVFTACTDIDKDTLAESSTSQNPKPTGSQTLPANGDDTDKGFDPMMIEKYYTFKLSEDGASYTVEKYKGDEKNIVIPRQYKVKDVTVIANGAFIDVRCDSVIIPNTVTEIEGGSFDCWCWASIANCGPKKVIFETGIKLDKINGDAFSDCDALESIEIPDGVTSIGKSAFAECRKLKEIKLPDTVTEIGEMAFELCTSLEEIKLPEKITEIKNYTFMNATSLKSIVIPDEVKRIGSYSFFECRALKSVVLPEGLERLDGGAFRKCSSLEAICIPASVKAIDDSFSSCSSVQSITVHKDNSVYVSIGNCLIERESKTLIQGCNTSVIPEDGSVERIDGNAFTHCEGLKSINIPASIIITGGTFQGCGALESISCADDHEKYYVRDNCLIERETKKLILGTLKSIIPDDGSVETIGAYSFSGKDISGRFTVPEGVTVIEERAFFSCLKMTEIDLPKSLTEVQEAAFAGSGLVNVTLPNGVEVSNNLFLGCRNLTTVNISTGTTSIGDIAFGLCTSLKTVTVPRTVESISMSFYQIFEFEKIIYDGTMEEWEAIDKHVNWCDNIEVVKCIDGDIVLNIKTEPPVF